MSNITRRQFTLAMGLTTAALSAPAKLMGNEKPRLVIVGGGAGGATAARYAAINSDNDIDITLIENSETYTTCFFSNLYVGGFRDYESITHRYDTLVSKHKIKLVTDTATEVNRSQRTVVLANGESIGYDRLIVAPGIDLIFDSVPGYSEQAAELAPHAWQAGPQTALLKQKLDALEDGDNIVMVTPPNPYRCPPGPYERASMMAHVLKTKNMTNSRITILDTKPKFSKQALFMGEWEKHYPGVIEWLSPDIHGGDVHVDAESGVVETDFDGFEGKLLNIIPAQKAGAIAHQAQLVNETGFCPINSDSMRSALDENIFVIGDACIAGDMPKSGFSANSQAKVAVRHIIADLLGKEAPDAQYANTCWSLISPENGVKVGAQYASIDGKITSTSKFISEPNESLETRKAAYSQSVGWYESIRQDMFG